jgi:2-polyprenyl-6-methoxyphenol hydroxylase-like FAD-dependent oxidoreductase
VHCLLLFGLWHTPYFCTVHCRTRQTIDAVWSQRLACKQEEPTVRCNLACHVLTAMLCRYEDADAGDCITSHFRGTTNAASITTAASTAQEQQQQQPAGVSVSAQLLVAADGYFSRVRRQCLADGPPEVRGSIVPLVCINTYFCTTALAPPA